jgi:4-hydroxy-tetrahydrodipicolinate synthase
MTVAMATPLDREGAVDRDGLQRLTQRIVDQGAAAVFPLGWTGEQPALLSDARREVIERVVRVVDGRVPVICGISEQSLPRALVEADVARDAGADVLLATPPFSYPLTGDMILDFFAGLASKSQMPIILYNNWEAHKSLTPAEIEKASRIPGMIGVKDFSDFIQLQRLLANVHRENEFIVWAAEEYVLGPALYLGARYSMLGGPGNLVGDWGVRIHECAEQGQWIEVAQIHKRILALCDALYPIGGSPFSVVKAALGILGFGAGNAIPPLPTLQGEELARVQEVLTRFEIL